MYTEDEAKTKWCPWSKGQYPRETCCKASECMRWGWVKGPTEGQPRKGYCGKLGKP